MRRFFTKDWVILLLASIISVGIYLFWSNAFYKIGYPLDDAWIHQTYARNLVTYHEWSFIPGQNTSGSTAPLWTFLLSFAYLIHLNSYLWTFLLGTASLFFVALLAERIVRSSLKEYSGPFPWVGLFIATEWHLVWAAGSGMETLLQGCAFLGLIYLILREKPNWWLIGGITSLSVWIRPEGITWLGPIGLILLVQKKSILKRLVDLAKMLACLLPLLAGYLLFNKVLSGTIFPNTFYAKQVEYSIQLMQPFLKRFFSIFSLPLIGSSILLLPGFLYDIYQIIKQKDWKMVFIALWYLGFIIMYTTLLPVTYQYGRYIMPAMPIFFIIGLIGTIKLISLPNKHFLTKVLTRGWVLSIILLSFGFFVIGGKAYSDNVRLIESEMVKCAQWINQNTPQESLIAAHDIGALGYFGNRRIIDLAGLISPEIIPIMRNEAELSTKLDQMGADYLMTFPSWYKTLPDDKPIVFTGGINLKGEKVTDNMTVYLWKTK